MGSVMTDRLVPMSFKTQKDVPVPPAKTKYPFSEMQVGDSIVVPNVNCTCAAYAYGRKHKQKFRTRAQGDWYRIWRVE